MSERSTERLAIPHPQEKDCSIIGTLEQWSPPQAGFNSKRKIAVILHGAMGHKDYLFQKRLAQQLPIDSFRFDFRGCHETPGNWRMGGLADDVVDLQVVVDHLTKELGYEIDMLVGHSRGSLICFYWLSTAPEAKTVTKFVNVSGRYRMEKILETKPPFNEDGYYELKATVARKPFTTRVYQEDVHNFATWRSSRVTGDFPPWVHVLTVHGMQDKTVPVYDALIYASTLSGRKPGTFAYHLSETADHNFTGLQDEVVSIVLGWLEAFQRDALVDGLWLAGVKPGKGRL